MKRLFFILFIVLTFFIFLVSGCMNSSDGPYTLDTSEYGVYDDGSLLFSSAQLEGITFDFATYESSDRITTKRGLQVGDSIEDFFDLYGESNIELLIPEHSVSATVSMSDYMKNYEQYKGMDINIISYFYKDEMHPVTDYLELQRQNPNLNALEYEISQYSMGIFFNRQERGKEDSNYDITIGYYSDIKPYVAQSTQGIKSNTLVEFSNNWDEWDSLEKAEKAVGFEFGLPTVITDSYKADSFRTLNNELIEVVYHDGKYEVAVRKQKGEGQDISGDNNEYLEQDKEERSGAIIEWFWGLSDNNTSYNPSKALINYNGFSWSLVAPKGYWGDSAEDFLVAILKDL